MSEANYEIAIIGGGGAGLTAALYASRANLKTVLFEKLTPGGQIALTHDVENYPGFPEGVSGPDIAMRMEEQAKKYGTEVLYDEVKTLTPKQGLFELAFASKIITAKAVILTMGASFRTLDVPGERELTGRGVSYCATCDGAFFKGKQIAVVGGGDSALQEGIFLTKFATSVEVIHRRDKLRASPILQDRAKSNPKIKFIWDTVVEKVEGDKKVQSLALKNVKTGAVQTVAKDGIFIFVGHEPNSALVKNLVHADEHSYVTTDETYATSVPGIFAAGEIRKNAVRQLVAACGEGCGAALSAQQYVENH